MNFRFGGTFLRNTAKSFFAKPRLITPVKKYCFSTVALRMQDLYD